tara:strand:- start:813 stop:1193 length:381 start_codon:yes stop_codon:yes gene_type:complete
MERTKKILSEEEADIATALVASANELKKRNYIVPVGENRMYPASHLGEMLTFLASLHNEYEREGTLKSPVATRWLKGDLPFEQLFVIEITAEQFPDFLRAAITHDPLQHFTLTNAEWDAIHTLCRV